jgi:hypothetical protein
MNRNRLTLILLLAALLAGAFLPLPTVQAAGSGEDRAAEPSSGPQAEPESAANPVVTVVVSLTGLLFGALAFLPLLGNDPATPETR